VNCSALPANLIESELFGHEKGSFTGANEKRVGKFEQAEGGTIFLDEIGELPLDMQVKFLRVLQEKESEPIGGKIKKLNVRIIAATNRNLEEEIAMGRFRLDLFYRLNVFPVTLPPLRDRRTDIPLLANHFLQYYSKENDKNITGFSERALTELVNYSWPGNVRELENLVYRSVILNKGTVIELVGLPQSIAGTPVDKIRTMEENEREHILTVLKKCDWKISGSGGAAEYLNIHVSTLNARIKKLGIKK
jgi:transcriptional regulator with GAF, ATPase, and Fis domain